MRSPDGAALMRMMATDWQHPDIVDLGRQIRGEHERNRARLIERAVARGELPRGSDAQLILDAALAPLYGRLKHGLRVDRVLIARLAHLVLAGARQGAAKAGRIARRRA